jgi:hypothetical protein
MFQFPHLPPSLIREGLSSSQERGCPIRRSTDRPASGSPWLIAALPRPSSALVAKASTIRPFSLVPTSTLPPTAAHLRVPGGLRAKRSDKLNSQRISGHSSSCEIEFPIHFATCCSYSLFKVPGFQLALVASLHPLEGTRSGGQPAYCTRTLLSLSNCGTTFGVERQSGLPDGPPLAGAAGLGGYRPG